MQILFDGYVSDELKTHILDIAVEYLNKHLVNLLVCNILIVFVDCIGEYCDVLGEVEHITDTCCVVRLNDNMLRDELIVTLRHELVHVKQFLNGELIIGGDGIIFNGVKFDIDHEVIHGSVNTPWEVEAENYSNSYK